MTPNLILIPKHSLSHTPLKTHDPHTQTITNKSLTIAYSTTAQAPKQQ